MKFTTAINAITSTVSWSSIVRGTVPPVSRDDEGDPPLGIPEQGSGEEPFRHGSSDGNTDSIPIINDEASPTEQFYDALQEAPPVLLTTEEKRAYLINVLNLESSPTFQPSNGDVRHQVFHLIHRRNHRNSTKNHRFKHAPTELGPPRVEGSDAGQHWRLPTQHSGLYNVNLLNNQSRLASRTVGTGHSTPTTKNRRKNRRNTKNKTTKTNHLSYAELKKTMPESLVRELNLMDMHEFEICLDYHMDDFGFAYDYSKYPDPDKKPKKGKSRCSIPARDHSRRTKALAFGCQVLKQYSQALRLQSTIVVRVKDEMCSNKYAEPLKPGYLNHFSSPRFLPNLCAHSVEVCRMTNRTGAKHFFTDIAFGDRRRDTVYALRGERQKLINDFKRTTQASRELHEQQGTSPATEVPQWRPRPRTYKRPPNAHKHGRARQASSPTNGHFSMQRSRPQRREHCLMAISPSERFMKNVQRNVQNLIQNVASPPNVTQETINRNTTPRQPRTPSGAYNPNTSDEQSRGDPPQNITGLRA